MKWFLLLLLLILKPGVLKAQGLHSILIDEIMADPTPVVNLPAVEWIELKNVSGSAINLQGWRFGSNAGRSGAFPAFTLQPDSFLLISTTSAATTLRLISAVIGIPSFPSLANESDLLYINNAIGATVDAINYSDLWYQQDLKKQGGWSLEMIDLHHPCAGINNWKASIDPSGGTPGRMNSVNGNINSYPPPLLNNAFALDDHSVLLEYDQPVDSASASSPRDYQFIDGPDISGATAIAPLFNSIKLTTVQPLLKDSIYLINVSGTADCEHQLLESISIHAGYASDPASKDIVVNEILFNPRPNAFDYVEIFNSSKKVFDIKSLYLANRNNMGSVDNIRNLSPAHLLIYPGDYFVFTEDIASLQREYLVKNPGHVIQMAALPSFPDDEGNVIVLNGSGDIVDEIPYSEDWHFPLIANKEGVALERINPDGPSGDPKNWHSAASTAGYGTPGYKNSQYMPDQEATNFISISPALFSPDNDGNNDLLHIFYKTNQPGYVASINIFDASGMLVRQLAKNDLLGNNGQWVWDGLGDRQQALQIGVYIIAVEWFDLVGKKGRFRKSVVLARRFD